MLTPLDRVRRELAERGIPLAMGSLVSFIERAADLLAPFFGTFNAEGSATQQAAPRVHIGMRPIEAHRAAERVPVSFIGRRVH